MKSYRFAAHVKKDIPEAYIKQHLFHLQWSPRKSTHIYTGLYRLVWRLLTHSEHLQAFCFKKHVDCYFSVTERSAGYSKAVPEKTGKHTSSNFWLTLKSGNRWIKVRFLCQLCVTSEEVPLKEEIVKMHRTNCKVRLWSGVIWELFTFLRTFR